VPALEPLRGLRVVADPPALDAARWTPEAGVDVTVLRINPDDAFAIGATAVELDDPYAIVEPEVGFVGGWGSARDLERHAEWFLPAARPALAQGSLAGVPAKVWLPDGGDDDRAFLVCTAAASATLAERLGWSLS
jgi:hypothetical protein